MEKLGTVRGGGRVWEKGQMREWGGEREPSEVKVKGMWDWKGMAARGRGEGKARGVVVD